MFAASPGAKELSTELLNGVVPAATAREATVATVHVAQRKLGFVKITTQSDGKMCAQNCYGLYSSSSFS